jgi:hypothetical protein
VNLYDPEGLEGLVTDWSSWTDGSEEDTNSGLDPMTEQFIASWNYWLEFYSNYDQAGWWGPGDEDEAFDEPESAIDELERLKAKLFEECLDWWFSALERDRRAALRELDADFLASLESGAVVGAVSLAIRYGLSGAKVGLPGGLGAAAFGATIGAVGGASVGVFTAFMEYEAERARILVEEARERDLAVVRCEKEASEDIGRLKP